MLFSVTAASAMILPGAVMAAALPVEIRMPAGMSSKIVGGDKAKAGEFPYIVSLSQSDSHFCGGILVGEKTVVTAAHCSVDVTADQVKVRAGTTTWAKGGDQVDVAKITVHPKYSPDTMDNDIAVWTLAAGIEQDNSTIKYAVLPESGFDPTPNTTLTVSGWGLEQSNASAVPADLRRVNVTVVAREECDGIYSKEGTTITENMFCASSPGKDSCQGDSGGPLVDAKTSTLVGVVSWGFGCATPGYPGVYANVGRYLDFIHGKESEGGSDDGESGSGHGSGNGNDEEEEDEEEDGHSHHHHGSHGDDEEYEDEEYEDEVEKSSHGSHKTRAVPYWV